MKCVICGKESRKILCPKCYIERNEIVSINCISLIACPRCGCFKFSGKWRKLNFDEALQIAVEDSLHLHPDFIIRDVWIEKDSGYVLKIEGDFWGEQIKISKEFQIYFNKELCLKCSRKSGGYYESIVQVRADKRKLYPDEVNTATKIVEEVIESAENVNAFVSKIVERKEGIDYYIGSREMGKKISKRIAQEFGGKIAESKKISGRVDGKEIFRFTYLVRLPSFRKGDIVMDNSTLVIVTSQKSWKGIALSGESINLKNPYVVVRKEDVKESFALNADSSVIEILHPATNEVVMAENKWGFKSGDSLLLVEHENKFYAFPKELMD
jgi:nonsense-mediated mRNA decay protein 3